MRYLELDGGFMTKFRLSDYFLAAQVGHGAPVCSREAYASLRCSVFLNWQIRKTVLRDDMITGARIHDGFNPFPASAKLPLADC